MGSFVRGRRCDRINTTVIESVGETLQELTGVNFIEGVSECCFNHSGDDEDVFVQSTMREEVEGVERGRRRKSVRDAPAHKDDR